MNTQKITLAIATQIMLVAFSIFLPLRAVAQSTQPTEADQDNIYHEDENLPDDAMFSLGWDILPELNRKTITVEPALGEQS